MTDDSALSAKVALERGARPLHERAALVAVSVQFFVNGAASASFAARAPQLRDNIGASLSDYGLLLTGAAVVGICSSLLAGRIVHGLGTRRVLALGAGVMTLALPVIGWANQALVWMVGMAAYVFCDTLVDISMNLQGSRLSARGSLPIMNRLHGLWSVGTLTGGLGAVAANAFGWSPAGHLSVVALVTGAVLAVTTRHLLPDAPDDATRTASIPDAEAPRTRLLPLLPIVLAGMFAVTMEGLGSDWATFRLSDDLGASAAIASAALATYSGGMMPMRLAGDHLQARLGRQTLHRASVALAALGFALATLVPLQVVSLVGFLLAGLGVATFMPKLYDDAARIPGRRGAGLGAMTAGMRVACLVTPAAVGALTARGLSLGQIIALGSLSGAVGLIVVSECSVR